MLIEQIQVLTCKLEATEEELKQTKFQLQEALQSILTIEEQSMHKMKIENDTNARLSAEIVRRPERGILVVYVGSLRRSVLCQLLINVGVSAYAVEPPICRDCIRRSVRSLANRR